MDPNIIVTETLEVPDIPGIGYHYFQCMKLHAKCNKIAQIDGSTGQEETYDSLLKRCIRTSLFLKKIGIQKGDVVCLFGPNNLDSCVPFISSHFIGAIPTCIISSLPAPDTKHLIKLVEPKIFFTTAEHVDLLQSLLKELEMKAEFVVFDEHKQHYQFSDINKPNPDEDSFTPIEIKDPKETAILYFSSGTSGLPKAVCINHYSMLFQIAAKRETENPDIEFIKSNMSKISDGKFVNLNYSPLYWVTGGTSLFLSTCHGVIRISCDTFDAAELWDLVDKYKVNFICITSLAALELTKHPKPADKDAYSILSILVTGSRAPSEVIMALREQLPTTTVFQGYAQTEFAGSNTYFDTNDKIHRKFLIEKPDSVGLPGKGITYKVVDPDTNEILGPNQEGELYVKGQTMMNGYYKMDSSEYFDEDGFYKTGDIVYYDDEKCFYVVDRIKEIFKYKHFQISPFLIQEVVLQHPAVKQAAVFGYPHPEDRNHAMAIVVLNENATATPEEIREFVDSRVDDNKKLRGGVKIVNFIPMTPTGKVKIRDLKSVVNKI